MVVKLLGHLHMLVGVLDVLVALEMVTLSSKVGGTQTLCHRHFGSENALLHTDTPEYML